MKGKSKENIKTSNQLSFPDVTSYDHLKSCPRYTSSKLLIFLRKQKGSLIVIIFKS